MAEIRDEAELRVLLCEPSELVRAKVVDRLNDLTTAFVDRAELPSPGELHRSLSPGFDAESYDEERAGRYARREGFY